MARPPLEQSSEPNLRPQSDSVVGLSDPSAGWCGEGRGAGRKAFDLDMLAVDEAHGGIQAPVESGGLYLLV